MTQRHFLLAIAVSALLVATATVCVVSPLTSRAGDRWISGQWLMVETNCDDNGHECDRIPVFRPCELDEYWVPLAPTHQEILDRPPIGQFMQLYGLDVRICESSDGRTQGQLAGHYCHYILSVERYRPISDCSGGQPEQPSQPSEPGQEGGCLEYGFMCGGFGKCVATCTPRAAQPTTPPQHEPPSPIAPVPDATPVVSFSADRDTLKPGECANLRWDVEHVQAVYVDGVGVVGHGSKHVCPATTTTYSLRAVAGGQNIDRSVQVTVYQPEAPAPVPPPSPEACSDDTVFVSDITYPDGSAVEPGQRFDKTWRIRNSGTCAWSSGYGLVHSGNDGFQSDYRVDVPYTAPGDRADVTVSVVAPTSGGTQRGYWQMINADSQLFGPRFWVEVNINIGTPTPVPCGDDARLVTALTESTQTVDPGGRAVFGWRVQNVGNCSWSSGYRVVPIGGNLGIDAGAVGRAPNRPGRQRGPVHRRIDPEGRRSLPGNLAARQCGWRALRTGVVGQRASGYAYSQPGG